MRPTMASDDKRSFTGATVAAAVLLAASCAYFLGHSSDWSWLAAATGDARAQGTPAQSSSRGSGDVVAADSVNLSDSQLASVKVEPVAERDFPIEKQAVGSIDFNGEMS